MIAAGHGSTPEEADRFLARIGTEINSAIKDGRLAGRWTPIAMLDPAWSQWLPRLPQSLHRVGGTFVEPAATRSLFDRTFEEAYVAIFDKIANRRSYLTARRYGRAAIEGWAFAEGGLVQAVEVRSLDGSLLGRAPLDIPRPDVDKNRPVGFRVSLVVSSESSWQKAQVAVALNDGTVIQQSLSDIPTAQVVHVPKGSKILHMAIDRIQLPDFHVHVNRLWKAQSRWEAWFLTMQSWLLWPCLFAGLAAIVLSIVKPRPIDLAIAILAVAVSTRLLFFAILDASAWPGDQPRYLFAVYPLFSLLMVLLFARLFTLPNLWKKDS